MPATRTPPTNPQRHRRPWATGPLPRRTTPAAPAANPQAGRAHHRRPPGPQPSEPPPWTRRRVVAPARATLREPAAHPQRAAAAYGETTRRCRHMEELLDQHHPKQPHHHHPASLAAQPHRQRPTPRPGAPTKSITEGLESIAAAAPRRPRGQAAPPAQHSNLADPAPTGKPHPNQHTQGQRR
jgi:hypothetical protein